MSCCYLELARMKSTKHQPKTMAVNWIQWTNQLSSALVRKWNAFLLLQVKELSILRHLCTDSELTVSFCLFSDVSELGYAANFYVCCVGIVWCVYIVYQVSCYMYLWKGISLPRLELKLMNIFILSLRFFTTVKEPSTVNMWVIADINCRFLH